MEGIKMALGDRNNNQKKMYEATYYSRVRFKDYDNKLVLGFQYKSGMLIVTLSKEKDGFQYEDLTNIYITPTKAMILMNQINAFKEALASGKLESNTGFGINAGMGEIVSVLILHTNDKGGVAITLGKVDGSGKYTVKETFNFSQNFHYGLKWNDIDSMKCEKQYTDSVEFDQFVDTIKSFAENSNGALGYTVADITRFDTRSILNKMNPIYDKLGIERGNNNFSNAMNPPRSNYFNNGASDQSAKSEHKSYDEIDSLVGDTDEDEG
jgi:hypothetical protein